MKVVVCIKAPEKTMYRTANDANADLRRGQYGGCNRPPVRVYPCLRHWHLTSQGIEDPHL